MGLLRLLSVFFPLGALCWGALITWGITGDEDGGWCGRQADRLMNWIDQEATA